MLRNLFGRNVNFPNFWKNYRCKAIESLNQSYTDKLLIIFWMAFFVVSAKEEISKRICFTGTLEGLGTVRSHQLWEPWSSGYRRRLLFQRLWFQIMTAPHTRCKNCNDVCLKRPKINDKRGRCWHIFLLKKLHLSYQIRESWNILHFLFQA